MSRKRKRSIQSGKAQAKDVLENSRSSLKEKVSISLKHYMPGAECFGEWTPIELKKFSDLVVKLRKLTLEQLTHHHSLCCKLASQEQMKKKIHPKGFDKGHEVFEMRLGRDSSTRIFGVLIGPVFYLMRLDRTHSICRV
ncbi:MAG: hypothetical protein WA908_02240 [Pontixanthobacter sp.]